jgi:hypothetical protein
VGWLVSAWQDTRAIAGRNGADGSVVGEHNREL